MIDDDDDETDKEKKRTAVRHKGTGIIGEYMKEGKKLAECSNGLPVDLTQGMSPASQTLIDGLVNLKYRRRR